jgi:serine/threonine protein phosphatase PrpC
MKMSLFAVIDGHGGDWCAHFVRKRLENELRIQINDHANGFRRHKTGNINECIAKALTQTFKNLDEAFYKEQPDLAVKCGATACVMLIFGNRAYIANVGDSRAVLCRNGKALNLSHDHKTVIINPSK